LWVRSWALLFGELISGKTSDRAMGPFAGFMAGTLLKELAVLMMGYYFSSSL